VTKHGHQKREETREREGKKKSARCLSTTIRLPYTHTHNISQLSHPPYRQVHLVSLLLLLLHSNTHTQRETRYPWEKKPTGRLRGRSYRPSPTTRLAGSRAALQTILTLWQPAIHIPSTRKIDFFFLFSFFLFFGCTISHLVPTQVHRVQNWL
jgi:hypothetical protein